jgi:predicted DNA-binding transcriptional regulator AlpA
MNAFLDEKSLALLLCIPRRTLQRWRVTGDGPPFVRAGLRRIIYRREAVEAWAASREHRHRAAELTAHVSNPQRSFLPPTK